MVHKEAPSTWTGRKRIEPLSPQTRLEPPTHTRTHAHTHTHTHTHGARTRTRNPRVINRYPGTGIGWEEVLQKPERSARFDREKVNQRYN